MIETKVRDMYHTQEKREARLTQPIICVAPDAWLGEGYYFWYERFDARKWGNDFKHKTGCFEIYKAEIHCENTLDTVFNEEHYKFWRRQIENAASALKAKNNGRGLTLKELNQYFKTKAKWNVSGILFQDIPETNSTIKSFYYRKRIQMVVYDLDIVSNFVHVLDAKVERK